MSLDGLSDVSAWVEVFFAVGYGSLDVCLDFQYDLYQIVVGDAFKTFCYLDSINGDIGPHVVKIASAFVGGLLLVKHCSKFELCFNEVTSTHTEFVQVASKEDAGFGVDKLNSVEDPFINLRHKSAMSVLLGEYTLWRSVPAHTRVCR